MGSSIDATPRGRVGPHGNYHDYRRRRQPPEERLRLLRPEWISGRHVLDVGCNDGDVAISIARNTSPARVVGVDLDRALVARARQQVRTEALAVADTVQPRRAAILDQPAAQDREQGHSSTAPQPIFVPVSCTDPRPPLSPKDGAPAPAHPPYPFNVLFRAEDVASERATSLLEAEQYDLVLCLSVTKWIHLNHGDSGITSFFERVYRSLRIGGVFVLEPQPWSSYKRKRNASDAIRENSKSIKLNPSNFEELLLKSKREGGIGFSSSERLRELGAKGSAFNREVFAFFKR